VSDSTPKTRWKVVFWTIFINAGLLLLIFGCIEYVSRAVNARAGEEAKPFMLDLGRLKRGSIELQQEGTTTKMSFLDPHLGFAHEHAADSEIGNGQWLPGFVIYGDATADDAFHIIALGGSTTDPIDGANWPKQLHQILEAEGIPAVVYNGGVSGYSTSQELFKLIRDVLPLRPDLILSLSGVNDLAFVHSVPGHPMVHPYQQRLLEAVSGDGEVILLPNTRRWIHRRKVQNTPEIKRVLGVNYGPVVSANHVQHWGRNTRLMHAVATSSNIEYISFLQPILGVGTYNPGPGDEVLLRDAVAMFGPNYLLLAKDFFVSAGNITRQRDFSVDLIDVFGGGTGLYRDQRHPNTEGYRRIAVAIREEMRVRDLPPAPVYEDARP